jgi:hypothetical protein
MPISMIAIITSDVATGRRMKGAEMFMSPVCCRMSSARA